MASAHEPGEVTWVDVPGGRLAVEVNSQDSEPVLAIHGISSQRKLWNWLRAAAPGLSLVAPDLRGRGDSVDVALSSSIGRHAADMVFIMNHLGLETAHVCGMSMGGFVAAELATTYPGRVKSLILVDARAAADLIAEALS
jgi:pimeloyl-ACP methyl ester carboxylesterase